jgi:hypothetical protein
LIGYKQDEKRGRERYKSKEDQYWTGFMTEVDNVANDNDAK